MTLAAPAHLIDLAGVNRALVQDLDVSHRLVTELQREREDLRREVEFATTRARQAEHQLALLVAELRELGRRAELGDAGNGALESDRAPSRLDSGFGSLASRPYLRAPTGRACPVAAEEKSG
jgi:hypothetical protein